MKVCSSCGRSTLEYAEFECPGPDASEKLVRCKDCRKNENKWQCRNCGTSGP